MLNTDVKKSYVEILSFIKLLDEEQKNKIPKSLMKFFEEEKDCNYEKIIYKNIAIKEQNLMKETLALIAFINLKYLCNDEEEKERLRKTYDENEKIYQLELHEKYNSDNIFKKSEKTKESLKENSLIIIKENIFIKLLNKLKNRKQTRN